VVRPSALLWGDKPPFVANNAYSHCPLSKEEVPEGGRRLKKANPGERLTNRIIPKYL
jgi:hypothetical protein